MNLLPALIAAFPAPTAQAASSCPERVADRSHPCTPSDADRASLIVAIQSAMDDYDAYKKAEAKEARLSAQINEERHPSLESLEEWGAGQQKMDELEPEMRQGFRVASEMTARYYGVAPENLGGRIHGGLLDGQKATWSPAMQEDRDFYYRVPHGKEFVTLHYEYGRGDETHKDSETMEDGSVLISFHTFEDTLAANHGKGDPAILAAALDVEKTRFEKLTCQDNSWIQCHTEKGGWVSKEIVELDALKIAKLDAEKIGLDSAHVANIEDRLSVVGADVNSAQQGACCMNPRGMG